jgi:hypothetical protein
MPSVDVRALLLAALRDARNWQAQLPRAHRQLVTLRKSPSPTEILAHPLGTLTVTQAVVPLGITISRFGNARPRGDRLFVIDRATVRNTPVDPATVTEPFARGQFLELSDDERLSAPSFERLPAGVEVAPSTLRHGPAVEAETEYETRIYDAATGQSRVAEPYVLTAERLTVQATVGAAAVRAPSRAGRGKYRRPAVGVKVGWPGYAVATTDELQPRFMPTLATGVARSYTVATQALRKHTALVPEDRGKLQVITTSPGP